MEEESGDEEKEVERDVGKRRGRIWKEREAKGKGEVYAQMENMNVTSLDEHKEAPIQSKAKVIFFQEHKARKDEKKKMEMTLEDNRWIVHIGPCDETGKMQRRV